MDDKGGGSSSVEGTLYRGYQMSGFFFSPFQNLVLRDYFRALKRGDLHFQSSRKDVSVFFIQRVTSEHFWRTTIVEQIFENLIGFNVSHK